MPAGSRPTVTLYSRAGCALCHETEELLRKLAGKFGFETAVVDIETDDDLLRRYMLEIPVVAVAGEVIAQAPIRRAALEEALRTATR